MIHFCEDSFNYGVNPKVVSKSRSVEVGDKKILKNSSIPYFPRCLIK